MRRMFCGKRNNEVERRGILVAFILEGAARMGTGMFSPPQAERFGCLPKERDGKTFPLVHRGMGTGWDGGKAAGWRIGCEFYEFSVGRDPSRNMLGNKSRGTDIDSWLPPQLFQYNIVPCVTQESRGSPTSLHIKLAMHSARTKPKQHSFMAKVRSMRVIIR